MHRNEACFLGSFQDLAMIELQLSVADTGTANTIWQMLIRQEHGADDLPAIGAAYVEELDGPKSWRFWYDADGLEWKVETLAPVAEDLGSQLDNALGLDHHLHLSEWFEQQDEEVNEVVREGLRIYREALGHAEAARFELQRLARLAIES